MTKLVSVVELPTFLSDVRGELADEELEELKFYLAANPDAGALIKGTGGVRKLRWAASGRGKSGGGRVIYYFHDHEMPLFLISFFTKSEKANLSDREKKAAKKLTELLVQQFKPR